MREKNEDICCQNMQKRDLSPRRSYSLFIGNKGGRFYLQGLSQTSYSLSHVCHVSGLA